jgi:hypothetical protein
MSATQWHDPAKTPLPPVGTRVLVYSADLANQREPWRYGIETALVTHDAEMGPVAEGPTFLLEPCNPGWLWAFAPALPDA